MTNEIAVRMEINMITNGKGLVESSAARGFACALISCLSLCQCALGESRAAIDQISLSGVSQGGTLQLARVFGRYASVVTVTNAVGDQGNVVAERIAVQAQASPSFRQSAGYVKAAGNAVKFGGFPQQGNWVLAGTDAGFNTVPAPSSLSVRYDSGTNAVRLRWTNPTVTYASVVVTKDGQGLALLPGDATSFVHAPFSARLQTDLNDSSYCVVGYRDGRPSNAAGIHLAANQQDELFSLPFVMGVAPNWRAWSNDPTNANVAYFQGTKPNIPTDRFFSTAAMKPSFQGLSASGDAYAGGTWREFLGLVPGATYRISLRVNTLAATAPGVWAFSVHAAYGSSAGTPLTPEQMSGGGLLPDGSQGLGAGRIAEYSSTVTTEGRWMLVSTGTADPGKVVWDITLPNDVDVITVWTRLRGEGVNISGIGVDWVAVEQMN